MRAAHRRWRVSPTSRPGAPRGHRATSRRRSMSCGPRLPARSGRARPPCCRARPAPSRPPPKRRRSWPPADCLYARPAPISGKASRPSSPPIWQSPPRSCGAESCSRPRERAIPGRRASPCRRLRSPAWDNGAARAWLSSSGCEGTGGARMATRDKAGRPIVVVTGMGIVTSLGTGKDENWTKLTAGDSGIRRITRFDTTGLRTTIAGTVGHVYTPGMEPSVLSETIAWLAGEEAVAESRLDGANSFPGPLFLAMPPLEIEWSHRLALSEDARAGQPIDYGTLIRAASSGRFTGFYERAKFGIIGEPLPERFGTQGLPIYLTTACASGATSIQLGVEAIRRGECSAALVIGADGSVPPASL